MSKIVNEKITKLKNYWAEIDDLKSIGMVLYWDKQTKMPSSGSVARGEHLSTIYSLVHKKITSPELTAILHDLEKHESELDFHSDEAGMIRATRREYEEATKLPESLVKEKAVTSSQVYLAWLKAREENNFKMFVPQLKKSVDLAKRTAEALGYTEHPLDALINQNEPGFKTSELDVLFKEIKNFLVPLVQKINQNKHLVSDKVLQQYYKPDLQWKLGKAAVRAINFKLDEGSCDTSVHPFSIYFSSIDVRITSRINENDFRPCFFGFLHEAGHGQYMQGLPLEYRRTPLMGGISAGIHESSSRLWENIVGRSWLFTKNFYPVIKAFFPLQTQGISEKDWYKAVNKVKASYIRVEADEVTYNLHIMLRFEIEKGIMEGKYRVEDLEEIWNEKFKKYLGIVPPNPSLGVLQDIHWTNNFGGGFQGYTIGNLAASQLYTQALKDQPYMLKEFEQGDYSSLLEWTRHNLHYYGLKYTPQELLKKSTGQKLHTKAYFDYLTNKYSDIYELK